MLGRISVSIHKWDLPKCLIVAAEIFSVDTLKNDSFYTECFD